MASLLTLIDNLNEDLANEYKHWHFYIHAAALVQGLNREPIRGFLMNEAAGEMQHIQEFASLILGLGGMPTTRVNGFRNDLTDVKSILQYSMAMEDEVVQNYVERKKQAQALGGIHGSVIEAFVDGQILASRHDADNIRQMLRGL